MDTPSQVFDHLKHEISLLSYHYLLDRTCKFHDAQLELIKYTQKNHPRAIMMSSPDENQLFTFLLKLIGAKKVLDIGVYTGLSCLTLALGIPEDGKVIACDVSTEFTDIGKPYWKKAGVDHKIDLKIQPALKTLAELVDNGEGETFDFIFIDADKPTFVEYYEWAMKLVRKGGIIAIDNTLFHGTVVDSSVQSSDTVAVRKLNEIVSNDKRVVQTMLPIADGVSLVTKL
eukprot:gene9612-11779_t